jgi:DNA-binding LytR/AlgR family response regulator
LKVLIIEDEAPAARRLAQLIKECKPNAEIVEQIDSVEGAIEWCGNNPLPDLAFMDIQLADGLSFEIFEAVEVKCPVIFTTAYDEYAIKAFKVNSIDYLLKPVDKNELLNAFEKYDELKTNNTPTIDITEIVKTFNKQQNFKTRFLVKQGQRLIPVDAERIAYFFAEDKLVFMVTEDNHKYIVDYTLEQLEGELDPQHFFRANRKIITSMKAVKDIHLSFNGKLKIYLNPDLKKGEDIFVSRERASEFKNWIGN